MACLKQHAVKEIILARCESVSRAVYTPCMSSPVAHCCTARRKGQGRHARLCLTYLPGRLAASDLLLGVLGERPGVTFTAVTAVTKITTLAGIGQLREVQASSHDHAPNFDVCLGPALGEFGFLAKTLAKPWPNLAKHQKRSKSARRCPLVPFAI